MSPTSAQSKKHSWATYRDSIGDRSSMFAAIREQWGVRSALYAGSYLDASVSTALPDVTYLDLDKRAAQYFADEEYVRSELAGRCMPGAGERIEFLHQDYATPLPVAAGSVDLLISLYAGPVWDHCDSYLKPGGYFLANTSHGDASVAALDERLTLVAAVQHRNERYRLITENLQDFLQPKPGKAQSKDEIRAAGRSVAYTKTAFAYVFQFAGG